MKPYKVLLFSLLKYNSIPYGTPIFILHDNTFNLSEFKLHLHNIDNFSNLKLYYIDVSSKLNISLPISSGDHVSIATYYRLFIASILPINIQSIIYLDSDMLCINSIDNLFELKIDQPIAAVDHFSSADEIRLHGNTGGKYFQAGVLIIDLEYWRKSNIEETFLRILAQHADKILWWDQDVLNIAFKNKWMPLELGYNATQSKILVKENWYSIEQFEIKLIHYDGSNKPWTVNKNLPFHKKWHEEYFLLEKLNYSKYREKKIFLFNCIKFLYNLNIKAIINILNKNK